jgi:uncharacterized protein (TIGR02996 family)
MSSDLQALLAAIVADPSDDVARLVYADCLEENGNAARAQFIRLQIEAERHHPDSNARAELERQAQTLFAEHWVEWWGEVCDVMALRMPAPKPTGRLGKLAQWVGVRTPPGDPYHVSWPFWESTGSRNGLSVVQTAYEHNERNQRFQGAIFRRGFPECLALWRGPFEPAPGDCLAVKWTRVAPLDALRGSEADLGPCGPHLVGLRSLAVTDSTGQFLLNWLDSPYLERLESLELFMYPPSGRLQWSDPLASPRVRQLKHLGVSMSHPGAIADVAQSHNLGALRSLALDLDGWEAVTAFETLGGTSLARRLEALTLTGTLGLEVFRALDSKWASLRKLTVGFNRLAEEADGTPSQLGELLTDSVESLLLGTALTTLEELRIESMFLDHQVIDILVRSPLMKQLKHFACAISGAEALSRQDLQRLPLAFDPARIETLALEGYLPRHSVNALRERFGDRLRLLPDERTIPF